MEHGKLRADPADLIRLLSTVHGMDREARLTLLSGMLLDRPYRPDPLVGGAEQEERLVSRLDGFDCVTFVESVWALAEAETPAGLDLALRALRYLDGQVTWSRRNHYTSQWIARNEEAGHLERVGADRWTRVGEPRILSALADHPPVAWDPVCLPIALAQELGPRVRSGDLVAFVSTRDDLDVFHVGLLIAASPLRLRHAGRSAGRVVDEPLTDFLERNDTPGLLVARATDPSPAGGGC
jgi:hypothetical protein